MPVNAAMGHYNRNIYYDNELQDTKKAWSPALSLASRLEAFALPIVVETSNAEAPRRYVYIWPSQRHTLHTGDNRIHQWLYGKVRHVYITYPRRTFTLLCFWQTIWNFPRISNRQNQSVVNAFIYVLSHCPPTSIKGAIGVRQWQSYE